MHERLHGCEARIAEQPLDASLRVEHAAALREHGRFTCAQDELETARRLDPCAVFLDREWGASWLALGNDVEAEAAFTRALELAPLDAFAHRQRALARARLGKLSSALEDREAVVSLTFEPEVVLELADARLSVLGIDSALAALDAGIARLGFVPALVLRAISLEEERGAVDAALMRLERWGQSLPRKEQAFVLRGEILERARRFDEARRAFESAERAIEALGARQQTTRATQELSARARAASTRVGHAATAIRRKP
jgi:tetratricopeptide (TPR) repeat protein